MKKMKLVIDIHEKDYQSILNGFVPSGIVYAVMDGTPLPKGHGRLIDADKCLDLAWQNFYKHEDEMEKKIEDYLPIKHFHEQRGFEVCQQTLVNAPTIIEADKERQKNRSKTFVGIAKAMATQWGRVEKPNIERKSADKSIKGQMHIYDFLQQGEVQE